MLLTACDRAGNSAGTPIPKVTNPPTLPPQQPEDDGGDDGDGDNDGDGDTDGDGEDGLLANAGVALDGPGLPFTPDPTVAPPPAVRLTPNPDETPIAVDPLNKPTLQPLDLAFVKYTNTPMSISFDRPAGWKEDSPADSNVQFMEPESAARNGYRAMLTVRVIHKGARQDKESARDELISIMGELSQNPQWNETFEYRTPAAATLNNAGGYHAYYYATFNDIELRGRIIVVARGNSLYMMRITSTKEYYELYENIYRKVRETWRFL